MIKIEKELARKSKEPVIQKKKKVEEKEEDSSLR